MKLTPQRTLAFQLSDGRSLRAAEPNLTQLQCALAHGGPQPANIMELLGGLLAAPPDGMDAQEHQQAVSGFLASLTWPQLLEVHNELLAIVQGIDLGRLAQEAQQPDYQDGGSRKADQRRGKAENIGHDFPVSASDQHTGKKPDSEDQSTEDPGKDR